MSTDAIGCRYLHYYVVPIATKQRKPPIAMVYSRFNDALCKWRQLLVIDDDLEAFDAKRFGRLAPLG